MANSEHLDPILDPILPSDGPAKVPQLIKVNQKKKRTFQLKNILTSETDKSKKLSRRPQRPSTPPLVTEESSQSGVTFSCTEGVLDDSGVGLTLPQVDEEPSSRGVNCSGAMVGLSDFGTGYLKCSQHSPKPSTQPQVKESRPERVHCTRAVVIDFGTGYLKTGLAGTFEPSCIIPSQDSLDRKLNFVGNDLTDCLALDILHIDAVYNGIITDWDSAERLLEYAFRTMGIQSEEHAMLLSDTPLSPTTNREKLAEIMFESFSSPAMFVETQSVLSMYSYGRTSGLVLECGHGYSYAVPIKDGYYMPNYTSRAEYAGGSLDLYLKKLLNDTGHCGTWDQLSIIRDIKANCCYISTGIDQAGSKERDTPTTEYKLPDGNSITLGKEHYLCPEALFHPGLLGSHEPGLPTMVMSSISKCDISLKDDMLQNILICGGSTMFPGFPERLQDELFTMAPYSEATVVASQDRKHATWLGGSILASLSSFQSLWIQRKDYNERGPSIIYLQC